jgi:hypothetical protein
MTIGELVIEGEYEDHGKTNHFIYYNNNILMFNKRITLYEDKIKGVTSMNNLKNLLDSENNNGFNSKIIFLHKIN